MQKQLSRRRLFTATGALIAGASVTVTTPRAAAADAPPASSFRYCLNTSTIRGQKLPLVDEIEIIAKAGYDGIEPWIGELDEYVKGGGTLADLRKRLEDKKLSVEGAIGFFDWLSDDEAKRQKGLADAKRCMELVAQIGGKRIAAPAVGATKLETPLEKSVERYRALLEVGAKAGVAPQLEVWGASKTLHTLAEAAHIAIASGHPMACVLADVYHLHKGGSPFGGVRLLSRSALQCFHVNDYPGDVPVETLNDGQRVYPGDGAAPLSELFRDLRAIGFSGALSIELFNRDYWKLDAATVVKTALEKLKAAVKKSES
jgi:sugar phosphate isomerase/epimerase